MGLEDLDLKRIDRLQKEHVLKFTKLVNPEDLLPHLSCLTQPVQEQTIQNQQNSGAQRAAFKLTQDLPRCDNWFEQLIPALRTMGLKKLADHLDDPQVDPSVERPGVRQNGPRPDPNFNPGSNGQPEHQGYSIGEVEQFKLEKSPTEALLKEWGIQENAILNTLMKALKDMEREDVHSQLQKVLGFQVKGSGQIPLPKSPPSCSVTPQPSPSVDNLPKKDLASGHNDEAKVVIRKPLGKRNDEPRDSSSAANRTRESVADGEQKTLNNGNKRNAGKSGLDINNTRSSGLVEAEESHKDCPVTDQVGAGQCSSCSEASCSTTYASKPITDGGKSKLETGNKTDMLDQGVEPDNKKDTNKGDSIINNLNRNPHAMKQNITSDQGDSAPKPKPQNNQLFVEDNLRESDQQGSNVTMRKGTKMVAGDAGEGDTNTASVNNNLERQGQAADRSSSDSGDENCSGKMLQSQFSLASTTSSSNNDMSTMYSVTGPDDVMGSLKNPDEFDKLINLEFSNSSFPSNLSDANDSKSLEKMADSQSMAMHTPGSKSTQNATSKDKPSSSATPSPLATPDLTASSTHPVVATPNTKGLGSRQKSMKGTPVTQPGYVPEDVPGGLKTPSVDATFSKDSLMIAVTPGRMLHQPQTASTEEAAGRLQEPSLEAKEAASEIEHGPNNTQHSPPSHNIGTNSPITSPQSQNQSLSEDNPSPECQESSAPVTPEIEEPQRGSVLGSILHAGPALLSIMSALQSGDIVPFKN